MIDVFCNIARALPSAFFACQVKYLGRVCHFIQKKTVIVIFAGFLLFCRCSYSLQKDDRIVKRFVRDDESKMENEM